MYKCQHFIRSHKSRRGSYEAKQEGGEEDVGIPWLWIWTVWGWHFRCPPGETQLPTQHQNRLDKDLPTILGNFCGHNSCLKTWAWGLSYPTRGPAVRTSQGTNSIGCRSAEHGDFQPWPLNDTPDDTLHVAQGSQGVPLWSCKCNSIAASIHLRLLKEDETGQEGKKVALICKAYRLANWPELPWPHLQNGLVISAELVFEKKMYSKVLFKDVKKHPINETCQHTIHLWHQLVTINAIAEVTFGHLLTLWKSKQIKNPQTREMTQSE